jgi:FkbM family methyltransferase
MKNLFRIYQALFARVRFWQFNKLLFLLSLRGMGLLNSENSRVSGEDWFLRSLARPLTPLTVLDVGANIGHYSMLVRKVYPNSKVFAFEPHPKTFQTLLDSSQAGGFSAFNLGCSDTSGNAELFDYADDTRVSEHASMYQAVIEQAHKSAARAIPIRLTSIDAFAEQHGIQEIHLLKIDTEGNELKVLQGARKMISARRVHLIHFEFNEMNVFSRSFLRDFSAELPTHRFFRMLPDGVKQLDPYSPLSHELFGFQNIVAAPTDIGWPGQTLSGNAP